MGTDIHCIAIDANGKPIEGGKWVDGKDNDLEFGHGDGEPFGWRNYGVFSFLAGVRNYSGIAPISEPRGLPPEFSDYFREEYEFDLGDHSFSWLSVAELVAFDYERIAVDRRGTEHYFSPDGTYAGSGGGITLPENCGKAVSYRNFLGSAFFHDLAELQRIGADRVVFGFDS